MSDKRTVGYYAAIICTIAFLAASSPSLADEGNNAPPALMPSMAGPLAATSSPHHFTAGPLGYVYVSGALGGLGLTQNPHQSDGLPRTTADIGNAQIFVQNASGPVQFFLQFGDYALPSLGTNYLRAAETTEKTFNFLPQAYLKFSPTDNFSIEAGKLPTLLGAEYTFTYENMNIARGLLWNQENAVNRGIQANYATGPLSFSLSWNDGFYSNRFNWLTSSLAWTVDTRNTLIVTAGGNLGHTGYSSFTTPVAQNNGQIYDLIYTYSDEKLTLTPYLQYTFVPQNAGIGIAHDASTIGAALLAKYALDDQWSLSARAEYIGSNGGASAPNLLYGYDSKAWSLTVTPAFQKGRYFGRAEASYTRADNITPGAAFGSSGNDHGQARFMIETGILF
ncbi:MAG: outer membrane beta-barrel protein [Alphaproteobacteria bacterium]|nr:outer membrane beta-barrel protein [Alphaproteobacteria bacterium]